jgi:P-type Cu+ transporter
MKTETFPVIGMHCASCSVVIKKKIQKLEGVLSIDVQYASEKATVTYDPEQTTISDMNAQIQEFGYSLGSQNRSEHPVEQAQKHVFFSLPIALVIFFLMIWDMLSSLLPFIPRFPLPMNIFNTIGFVFSIPILFWIGKPYIRGVINGITKRTANMDTLIGIGTLTAFVYSAFIFLFPDLVTSFSLPDHTYFDVTIVVISFVTLGKYLEAKSKAQTGQAITKLLQLQATTATKINGETTETVPISTLQKHDRVRVRTGEKIPLDGVIEEGSASISEAMITGEPIPVDKHAGDRVIGGTINSNGTIIVRVTNVGAETLLSQIIAFVQKAQGTKAPIEKQTDALAAIFVPIVLVIALGTFFRLDTDRLTNLRIYSGISICLAVQYQCIGHCLSVCSWSCNADSYYRRHGQRGSERNII